MLSLQSESQKACHIFQHEMGREFTSADCHVNKQHTVETSLGVVLATAATLKRKQGDPTSAVSGLKPA